MTMPNEEDFKGFYLYHYNYKETMKPLEIVFCNKLFSKTALRENNIEVELVLMMFLNQITKFLPIVSPNLGGKY